MPKGGLVPLRRQANWFERIANTAKLLVNKREPEPDRVWVGVVDTQPRPTNVLIPASGGWTAPAEFARVVDVKCPCPMLLVRDAGGRVGAVHWSAPKKYSHLPVAAETARILKANVNVIDIQWHAEVGYHLAYDMNWAIQILPADDESTLMVMRTAAVGARAKRLGFGVFHKIVSELSDALQLVQERPAIHPPLRLLAPTNLAVVKRISERRKATRIHTAPADDVA